MCNIVYKLNMNWGDTPSCVLLEYSTIYSVTCLSQPTISHLIMITPSISVHTTLKLLVEPTWSLFWDIYWCHPNSRLCWGWWTEWSHTSETSLLWQNCAGITNLVLNICWMGSGEGWACIKHLEVWLWCQHKGQCLGSLLNVFSMV